VSKATDVGSTNEVLLVPVVPDRDVVTLDRDDHEQPRVGHRHDRVADGQHRGLAQLELEGKSPLPCVTLLVVGAHEELAGLCA
jgi:hypothetical protein